MKRHALLAFVAFAVAAAALLPGAGTARADTDDDDAPSPMTLEGHSALRARIWQRLLLATVRPVAGPDEDPTFLPSRYGQAVHVQRGGRTEVLAAARLVEGAREVRLAPADTADPADPPDGTASPDTAVRRPSTETATVGTPDDATLLVPLACTDGCRGVPATATAPADACAKGRDLFYVIPAMEGRPVMGRTLSLGVQPAPFDAMVAVAGKVPPGTVLFDPLARPAAIAVREAAGRGERTLASMLARTDGGADAKGGGAADDGAKARDGTPGAVATPDGTGESGLPPAPAATPDADLLPVPLGATP